ncbi:MAG: VCBS repeat-containing protein, partial [Anaerolineae bacterium]|nr:VCBS repeat-containing protein [Anaerolineae bacterium]
PQEVWLNQGGAQGGTSGDFGTAPADSFGSGTTYEVDLGDLDEDGDLDVILANYNGDKEVWLNQGGAQGGTPGDLGTSVHDSFSTSYRYAYDVELGDVNGDGALDAVVAHYNQYSEVWLNQKPVTWDTSNVATVTVTVNPIIIPPACFAEIDGDNTTDFASSDAGAVQAALDAVSTGGTVKLAGTCVGVQVTEWHTQTAYITRSVTVQGGHTTTDWLAAPDAVAHPTTLDADGNGRVFYITQDIAATVENLTVAGGSPSSGDEQGGAGFLIYSATVTINNTQIVTNTSTEHGGGILNRSGLVTIRNSRICNNQARGGGGIANRSTMTVENTILCDNVVSHPTELATGGAINNEGGTVALDGVRIEGNSAMIGGGILNQGSLVMTDTVVLSNTATMAGGGLVHTASTMALERSTVAYNSAPSGGGLYQTYMGPATFSARNSTFSQNSATAGGGGAIANAPYPGYSTAGGDVILDSVTLYNNPSTAAGSAIYNVTGTVTLSNTIVAETVGTAANCSHSGNGGIVSSGYNLDSGNSCGFAATGDVVNTNPNLAALADNGGPTPTHALHTGSPALDHGTCTVTTDQRGATRPMDGDADGTATCDIGAFELGWVQCGIQAALEPANYTFPGNVILNVTDDGSDLDCLRVTDIPHHHPQATSALETGKYWQFDGLQSDQSTAATTDYSLNVTLPWAGADNGDTVCRWTGATWDCAADSYVANTSVTRDNVTQLSDWAVEDNTPTAVTLASFTAAADGRAIRLAWETVSELDNLGFHLYRQAAAGERVRLNAALIPGQNPGSPAGAVYTWLDEGVTPGVAYTYWLEAVDAHGGAALHGPVQATLSPAPYRYYLPLVMGGF